MKGIVTNYWFQGRTRSGKTQALVEQFRQWIEHNDHPDPFKPTALIMAPNNRTQRHLFELCSEHLKASHSLIAKTPVGFFADEVELFFPLISQKLALSPQFPIRLRPEMEQKLATDLWRAAFIEADLNLGERSESRLVRRMLDLLQLAGAAGVEPEQISQRLIDGGLSLLSGDILYSQNDQLANFTQQAVALLLQWRDWCLTQGFLTYGIIYELYWRCLLPDETYQQLLVKRIGAIFADDVNDYPAIAKDLFSTLLDQDIPGAFTENPDSKSRLGLNADPDYLTQLSQRCRSIELYPQSGLQIVLGDLVQERLDQPNLGGILPDQIQSIQTISRAELLRKTANHVKYLVCDQNIAPADIAIIAPGLDEIARYTLIEILAAAGIEVEPLNEQRPLNSSPLVRSLLTLLALIYPGLGRLLVSSEVAEMLVMLSSTSEKIPIIDPVRAGLLVDYCFEPQAQRPQLLKPQTFPRWDRLGHQVTQAYEHICQWIAQAQKQSHSPDVVQILDILDQALRQFYLDKLDLRYDQLATFRELVETVQHYFECTQRCAHNSGEPLHPVECLGEIISLIRQETITANPRPFNSFSPVRQQTVTLATIFQYRAARLQHSYQFWLDAGSRLWEKGGAATLFGYGIFQRSWAGEPWSMLLASQHDQQRLRRIVSDLMGRTGQQIYLCHSDFGVNGAEQLGSLFPLVQSALEVQTVAIAQSL